MAVFVATLLLVSAPAQEVLEIPVTADGEFELPEGSEVEQVFRMESLVDGDQFPAFAGDGGPARDAWLGNPSSLAADTSGNVFVADTGNDRIRKIDTTGTITTFAGSGERGYGGDGGPARRASLNSPAGVAVDGTGNVYVADTGNNRVRRIDAAGVITTIAGTGEHGFGGDGGPASDALLAGPTGVAVDGSGNMYVADTGNNRVRRIDAAGVIKTIAGTGEYGSGGDGGPAARAQLETVRGVAADAQGAVYLASTSRIRRIDLQGTIDTLAEEGGSDVVVDTQGNVYLAAGTRVRKIDAQGTITTFAGTGNGIAHHLWESGLATETPLSNAVGLAVANDGKVYVTDRGNQAVRVVRPAFQITVQLGDSNESVALEVSVDGVLKWRGVPLREGSQIADSSGNSYALTQNPDGGIVATHVPPLTIPVLANGELDLPPGADTASVYIIETFAGTGGEGDDGDDGPATDAQIRGPQHLALDTEGNLFVAGSRLRRIDASGVVTAFADTSGPVAVDDSGHVYVADFNYRVRRIDAAGVITTIAGTGERGYSGDGGPAVEAQLGYITGVAADAAGNVYVADHTGHRVRRIDSAGVITTIAGTGESGYSGDGGPAAVAQLDSPGKLAVDASGNVYIADTWNHRIRKVDSAGLITTIAGTGERGYSGDGGLATEAQFFQIEALAVDSNGNVYISDGAHHRVRKIGTDGVISTIAGTGEREYSGDWGLAGTAGLASPVGLAVDDEGNVYVADAGNHRIRVLRQRIRIAVPLGQSGENVGLAVSADGEVFWRGVKVVSGTQVTASNGFVYSLMQRDDGEVFATYVPLSQSVDLGGGKRVSFMREETGKWRVGTQAVESSYRHVEQGREYLFEFADGHWRPALYTIRTVAGSDQVVDGVAASAARLFQPCDVAFDSLGNAFIGDSGNRRIRKVDALSGLISTHGGTGNWEISEDGGHAAETAMRVCSLAVDAQGSVYAADGFRVRRIDSAGTVTTYAGTGQFGDAGDGGPAAEAQLGFIGGVASDRDGNVYVVDRSNHRVRRIDSAGVITTYAGTGERGFSGDGGAAAQAQLAFPCGVAADGSGSVYVADASNHRVRRIDSAGVIATYAGTGRRGFSGDGGAAAQAQLSSPCGVAAGASGSVYVADSGNHRVRRIDSAGVIATYAGTGERGSAGDGGAATEADAPVSLWSGTRRVRECVRG